ncbi:MAG: hypothetical protein ACK5SI_05665, partial [Planctomycetia bacterium]
MERPAGLEQAEPFALPRFFLGGGEIDDLALVPDRRREDPGLGMGRRKTLSTTWPVGQRPRWPCAWTTCPAPRRRDGHL